MHGAFLLSLKEVTTVINTLVSSAVSALHYFHAQASNKLGTPKKLRQHEKAFTCQPPRWIPCFQKPQATIPKLSVHVVVFCSIYMHVSW